MRDKLVSIITPVFNAERFLEETIQSVLEQTYEKWEMILIDDSSTDNSQEIIAKYKIMDKRIKGFKLAKNSGAAVARNKGLEEAEGRYIAFLDSDDLWKKNKLKEQLKFMKQNNIFFSYTNYDLMNELGEKMNKTVKPISPIDYKELLKGNSIGCLTVIIDQKKIGEFKMPLLRKGQDYATWLNILRKGNVAYKIDKNLAIYRVVKDSLSRNKISALKRTWNIYYNYEDLNLIKSSYYFLIYLYRAIVKRI